MNDRKTHLCPTLTWRGRELSSYSKDSKQISYSYDVDGMRYKKTVTENNSVTAVYDYVYSDGKLILLTHTANDLANTARFIYDSFGEPRGFILNNSASYLYLKNGQGDITAIVDESGEILVRYTYNAWGAVEFIVPFGIDPAVTTVLATVSPFTYRGYCYDFDLGLYYLQSRYYDPEICRFINADSTDYLGATGTLLSYNLFAYCENDPVDYVDETGTYLYCSFSRFDSARMQYNARILFDSPNYPYFKNPNASVLVLIRGSYCYRATYKQYVHRYTYHNLHNQQINVIYHNVNNAYFRVVGTFMYKTVAEWKAYIINRHRNLYVRAKDWIIKRTGISSSEFDIVMNVLPDVVQGTSIENYILIFSLIDTIFEETANLRDELDEYISNCLYNKPNHCYIMFAWSLRYQQYLKIGRGYGWRTSSQKSIYDLF